MALEKAFGDKALNNAQSLTAEVNRLTNNLRELGNEFTRVFLELPNPLSGFAKVNEQIQGVREGRAIGFEGAEQRIRFITESAKRANKEFLEGNITLDQRNKTLQRANELIKEEAKANGFRLGGVDVLIAEKNALSQIAIERGKSLDQLRKTRDLARQSAKAEQERLERVKKIRQERELEREELKKQVKSQSDLQKAKKQREELELLIKLQDAQKKSLEIAKKQEESDPNSEANLSKKLKALREQKKLIDASRQSIQEANQVSFIGSFTNGFDQAQNTRKSILARSRQLGATKGDVELAKRQAEASERTADAIERIENQLEVINV